MSAPTTRPIDDLAFTEVDRHFAALMERLAGGERPALTLAAALASHRAGEGGLCADLRARDAGVLTRDEALTELELPEQEAWLAQLRASVVVGTPGEFKPLILDDRGRLYLFRCWEQEQQRQRADAAGGEPKDPQ